MRSGAELNFINGSNTEVIAGENIDMLTVDGAVTLTANTNTLNYTNTAVTDADDLETALDNLVTTSIDLSIQCLYCSIQRLKHQYIFIRRCSFRS